ncbi:MAG TPA: type VI secretion system contractile sheath large subunit [Polyangiaceae bacterium]|nr:MAG: hypothetical protein BWY17_04469 [Deltaproteobacteria bacterium ADurb.Bin207]HNS99832.1 type VI secretion system contractile sheath large subunit [Polyangiaceae bacterium]HNZ22473.1 type VI secretion system contractile sheath large subunit [Polyangiaceae bacterium]HOD23555.1 type VI secretion system contractile sheath large subunit [Polyangiaceae bacterium]HOE51072.1 type VI secretion system contractile sheath large subunit [Polyangiaceae bacterium]
MGKPSRGGIGVDVRLGGHGQSNRRQASSFRVLVVGDFSPGASPGSGPVDVDVMGLDDWLERWNPSILLRISDEREIPISFSSLDDFHPDALFDRLPIFAELRLLQQEARQGKGIVGQGECGSRESTQDTLARLLGKPNAGGASSSPLQDFFHRLVEPHVVTSETDGMNAQLEVLHEASGELMHTLLHHSAFQRLESIWRGLDFLLRFGEGFDVSVSNLSREELEAWVLVDDPLATPLGRRLLGEAAGEPAWSLVLGAYSFGRNARDVMLLRRLSSILAEAGVPMIASYRASEGGEAEVPSSWRELRSSREASMIGLALPRFLLRLPYGKRTDEISRFPWEEQTTPPQHDRYLWGHPGWLVACLLGRRVIDSGTKPSLSMSGLPVHSFLGEGQMEQTPCAEWWLTEQEAGRWLDDGMIPLCSVRGRDEVRLIRVQSLAAPSAGLAGF